MTTRALSTARLVIDSRFNAFSISSSLSRLALVLGLLVGTPHEDTPGRMEISYVPISLAYFSIWSLFIPTSGLRAANFFRTQSVAAMFSSVWLAFCPIASPVTIALQPSRMAICSAILNIRRLDRMHANFTGHFVTMSSRSGECGTR